MEVDNHAPQQQQPRHVVDEEYLKKLINEEKIIQPFFSTLPLTTKLLQHQIQKLQRLLLQQQQAQQQPNNQTSPNKSNEQQLPTTTTSNNQSVASESIQQQQASTSSADFISLSAAPNGNVENDLIDNDDIEEYNLDAQKAPSPAFVGSQTSPTTNSEQSSNQHSPQPQQQLPNNDSNEFLTLSAHTSSTKAATSASSGAKRTERIYIPQEKYPDVCFYTFQNLKFFKIQIVFI